MNKSQEATFGAGCFWCIEACFKDLKGVEAVYPGFSGGDVVNPSYEDVCNGSTGHAEVARVIFDQSQITFTDLLEAFWFIHDPTQLNRQGNDIGSHYRSVIFYHNEDQRKEAEFRRNQLEEQKLWKNKIVTEISPIRNFFKAEEYHHDYLKRNPTNMYCQFVVKPKYERFREAFSKVIK